MASRTTSSRFLNHFVVIVCCFFFIACIPTLHASILHVPRDYPTIQAGVDAAGRGDTVLVAPGTYFEQVLILKKMTISSRYLETGDKSFISKTTVDGGGGHNLTFWIKSGGSGTTISGLTITHGLDGVKCQAKATIIDNHIVNNGDGIDYSSVSGGLCARNVIENSVAEGIDIDDKVDITIENNKIRNNGSDGIEIQLQDYRGSTLVYRIRNNEISDNRFDGIQLVEKNGISDRQFYIDHNLFYNNRSSGVGMMGDGDLRFSFTVADIKDRVYIFNNTLVRNTYGVTGGDNVIALNNIVINSRTSGFQYVNGNSIAAYCLLNGNLQDFTSSKTDRKTNITAVPFLDKNYKYRGPGPGVDNGVANFVWRGKTVLDMRSNQYSGSAPDIGAYEYQSHRSVARILNIPDDYPTIQQGIDASIEGDTVLVASGEYTGAVFLANKSLTFASWFLVTGDTNYVAQTIIDGGGTDAITVDGSTGSETKISGFTIRNGRTGIKTGARLQVLHNRISQCVDGIAYEAGSGGRCAFNTIENNSGKGLALHGDIAIVIEDNTIRKNGGDGIEIMLNPYKGDLLTYIIRRNQIDGNLQDGIQLVDEDGASDREFYIERNLIHHNGLAGLGLMGNSKVEENFEGASLKDRIYLFNNTFAQNDHGVTGGVNMVALNNLFINTKKTALKNIAGTSIVAFSLLWANNLDFENCNIDTATVFSSVPLLSDDMHYMAGSAGIDMGATFYVWQGDTVLSLSAEDYTGVAPDIGAFEFVPTTNISNVTRNSGTDFILHQNYPNPFNAETKITFNLPSAAFVKLEIFNSLGQKIRTLVNAHRQPGLYVESWDGRDRGDNDVASGTYFFHLQAGKFNAVRKLSLLR